MAILDIDRWIERPAKNRVKLVGVELEGGWTKWPEGENWSQYFHHDASVKMPEIPEVASGQARTGEIVSPPIEPAAIGKWVQKWYPQHLNHTCGLHIHMSFFFLRHYRRLMVIDYQDTMMEYLKRWASAEGNFPTDVVCTSCLGTPANMASCLTCLGKGRIGKEHHIWRRLRGEEKNCQLKFWPDAQVKMTKHGDQSSADRYFKDGCRYTAINYCYSVDNRQTLEVRVLPMMKTTDQATRALKRVVRITNGCLAALRGDTRGDRVFFSIPKQDLETPHLEDEVLVL